MYTTSPYYLQLDVNRYFYFSRSKYELLMFCIFFVISTNEQSILLVVQAQSLIYFYFPQTFFKPVHQKILQILISKYTHSPMMVPSIHCYYSSWFGLLLSLLRLLQQLFCLFLYSQLYHPTLVPQSSTFLTQQPEVSC